MTSIHLADRAQARQWVRAFRSQLQRPCVVLLSGEMGAGKTQFVRWFLEELQGAEVASPTFAIHHRYQAGDGPVDHVDLYRVESDADLEASGFWDLLSDENSLIFVEWAERLPENVWPSQWRRVDLHLHKTSGEGRRLDFEIKPPSSK